MARWPFSPPGAPLAPPLRRWWGSRAIVGPSRMDLRRRRMNWDLTIMRPAPGTAGTGTSRWSCWPLLAAIRHRLNAETMTAEQLETVPSARPRPVRGRHRWDRGLDPLVGAGDPPRGRAAEPAAHPARSHHRLVALARATPSLCTHLAS